MLPRLLIKPSDSFANFVPATLPPAEIWRRPDGGVCAYGYTGATQHWMCFPGFATFSFSNISVRALVQRGAKRGRIRDVYERSVLPMAVQLQGLEALHASGVRSPRGIVALCGVSGTGKSTVAFGLSRCSYRLWGDDAVAFDPACRAVPLPFRMQLRSQSSAYFGESSGCRRRNQGVPVPMAMVVVLRRVENGVPMLTQLAPPAAFPAVLPHAYCFSLNHAERKRGMARTYLQLCARIPIFELKFSAGLVHLARMLELIEHAIATL